MNELKERIKQLILEEQRSCSMEAITPLYIYRHWVGKVDLKDIQTAFELLSEV